MATRELRPGDRFVHFKIIRLLGEGGMGKVYEAEHEFTKRRCALKLLNSDRLDADMRERTVQEARALAELEHPNIVRLYDANQLDDGTVWMAMEYLEGRTLRAFRTAVEVVPVLDALHVLIETCDGVAAAHEIHIIHRDLKPENVVLTKQNQPKVLDFGAAKILRRGQGMSTAVGASGQRRIIGTPEYMSPEHLRGARVDDRTDTYALGTMAFEMLARHPQSNPDGTMPETYEMVRRQFIEEPPSLHELAPLVPSEAVEAIHRALLKQASARPSVAELARALRAARAAYKVPSPDPDRVPFAKEWRGAGSWAASGPALSLPQQVTPPSDPSRSVVVQVPVQASVAAAPAMLAPPAMLPAPASVAAQSVAAQSVAAQSVAAQSVAPVSPPALVHEAPRSHAAPVYAKTQEIAAVPGQGATLDLRPQPPPPQPVTTGAAGLAVATGPAVSSYQAVTVVPATVGPTQRASHPARVRARRTTVLVFLALSSAAVACLAFFLARRSLTSETAEADPGASVTVALTGTSDSTAAATRPPESAAGAADAADAGAALDPGDAGAAAASATANGSATAAGSASASATAAGSATASAKPPVPAKPKPAVKPTATQTPKAPAVDLPYGKRTYPKQ